jgi:hypothetical protein
MMMMIIQTATILNTVTLPTNFPLRKYLYSCSTNNPVTHIPLSWPCKKKCWVGKEKVTYYSRPLFNTFTPANPLLAELPAQPFFTLYTYFNNIIVKYFI